MATSQHGEAAENKLEGSKQEDWVRKKRDALMVVATLLANMAFQAGLTPPGGLWDGSDNSKNIAGGSPPPAQSESSDDDSSREAGFPILAARDSYSYGLYITFNTTGYVASLSIILLLVSGLPVFMKKFFMAILTVVMWIAITAMAATYLISISALTNSNTASTCASKVLIIWFCLMFILIVGHLIRFLVRMIKAIFKKLMKCCCCRESHGSRPNP